MTDFYRGPKAAQKSEKTVAKVLTIGEISRLYSVTPRALRFYEERGLLTPIRKNDRRFYDQAQTARLQMILKGKNLGFTLAEITELLNANSSHAQTNDELALDEGLLLSQLDHLEKQRSDLDRKIEELRAAHSRLIGGANRISK
jgi:DNA-binding transcriptional MerR regulator